MAEKQDVEVGNNQLAAENQAEDRKNARITEAGAFLGDPDLVQRYGYVQRGYVVTPPPFFQLADGKQTAGSSRDTSSSSPWAEPSVLACSLALAVP